MNEFVHFISSYVQLIVARPEDVFVDVALGHNGEQNVIIFAHHLDMGRIIGKNANLINALSSFVGLAQAKRGCFFKIQVKDCREISLMSLLQKISYKDLVYIGKVGSNRWS